MVAGFVVPVAAQVELTLLLPNRVYLQFEPVEAVTTVRSRIGQPVVLNSPAPGSMRFFYEVSDEYNHVLSTTSQDGLPQSVMIAPNGTVVFTNRIDALFTMRRPGHYSIRACAEWMGKIYQGQKHHIEVVTGREVARMSGYIADGTTRSYIIFHINRGQQDHIVLRIDDEMAGLCYGVIPLGRSVMNEKPQLAMDADGNGHILFQSAPRTYTHLTFGPGGNRIGGRVWGQGYSQVSLQSLPGGGIEAVGAREERTGMPFVDTILPTSR